ncbi:L-2-hydroxyglutarate oxidase LhgO [Candidatus Sulfotelmatobacter kueseliae]|uniref:L-2-hydroxyglutarate oxidase LhgO n=1 Tax=Candidatus Sulfotelmatobacter kueseliae TaxID=2042962 RepID=A0A2U3K0S2_9BACT|nr:L-2-hydroxyglutarate oxidase LhgO [Candidatus Sulfotelmatobacter kueseliae]
MGSLPYLNLMTDSGYNVIIIGGGVVGLAVALEITRRFPRLRLLVLEKEDGVARHQSGHNSGVIHSGVYYKPGSLKARLSVAGAAAMVEFCREHGIPHKVCGKVIVATRADELPRLEDLRRRGEANGLTGLRLIGPEELRELEPHASGLRALLVPSTGITDYAVVCEKYAELISASGGTVLTAAAATGIRRSTNEIVVETSRGAFATSALINCAGLFSDRISRMAGDRPSARIIPFRGEYYDLVADRASLVRALIYPVPDPRFPFLGVHFTRRITGKVDAGPNAVLAFAREGYRATDLNLRDFVSALAFPGFWRMAARYWRNGFAEWYRSLSKPAFVHALQRMLPEVRENDLIPGGSGVRAQAVKPNGDLVDDFQFVPSGRVLHVLNVPSPAATASLTIARTIVDTATFLSE